jgi:FeS assembly SUF system protein
MSDFAIEQADAVPERPARPRLTDADIRAAATVEDIRDTLSRPPAASPTDGPRERDYLDGFLSQKPEPVGAGEPGGALYDGVIDALKEIYDPEIPVNIYDLGLVYGVDVVGEHVAVSMTLTTPNCPVAESMPGEVELWVAQVPGVATAEVNLVWDPPWDPQKMSDEAKLELGML